MFETEHTYIKFGVEGQATLMISKRVGEDYEA